MIKGANLHINKGKWKPAQMQKASIKLLAFRTLNQY